MTDIGDFLNKRPFLASEIRELLGLLANTETSHYSKGWEAAATKLSERYPKIDNRTIQIYKSYDVNTAADNFLRFCGSLCVTVDDFLWCLCYSGNDFVADKLVKAMTVLKTSSQNPYPVSSSQYSYSQNQYPVSPSQPSYPISCSQNLYPVTRHETIPSKTVIPAPAPLCEQLPAFNVSHSMSSVFQTMPAAPAPNNSSSSTEIAQVNKSNNLVRQFLTPNKYMILCNELGSSKLAGILDWKTFSYKLPNLKYSEIRHLYDEKNLQHAAHCFLQWWLPQPDATLINMYKALKTIGYNKLISDLQLTESTVITNPIPQPVNSTTLMRDAFDFEYFEKLCEYLRSTDQWKNVCQQLGIPSTDINIAHILYRNNALHELLAKWSEKPDSTVKRLNDVLQTTSKPTILYDIGILKSSL